MKNKKIQNSHYLSISYGSLISNKIIHYILFLIEVFSIFLQIVEIHYNSYKSIKTEKIKVFSFITPIIMALNKIKPGIKFVIYLLIILFETICTFLPNYLILSKNKFWLVIINLNEIIFYRLSSLFMFHFLFSFEQIYLILD